MHLNSDISSALQLLEEIKQNVDESDDPKLQANTATDLRMLISLLENPIFRSIVTVQDSLGELNHQLGQHPSILPVDFEITAGGELDLNVPPGGNGGGGGAGVGGASGGVPNDGAAGALELYGADYLRSAAGVSGLQHMHMHQQHYLHNAIGGGVGARDYDEQCVPSAPVSPSSPQHPQQTMHAAFSVADNKGAPIVDCKPQLEAYRSMPKPQGMPTPSRAEEEAVHRSPSAVSDASKAGSDSLINTEWVQVEAIDLVNDGTGLGFGIVGVRTMGVVVKTILPGGVANRDGRLQSGDHILQIGDVNLHEMGSEQVATVLRNSGTHVRLVVARPADLQAMGTTSSSSSNLGEGGKYLSATAPLVPTRLIAEPVELDRYLIQHKYAPIFQTTSTFGDSGNSIIYQNQPPALPSLPSSSSSGGGLTRIPASPSLPLLNLDMTTTSAAASSSGVGITADPSSLSPTNAAAAAAAVMPEMEQFTVELKKDAHGLGITIAGYVCEKEELSGIFVKSVSRGSAADVSGRIRVNDRIVAVDGRTLHGYTNIQAVEVLRSSGTTVQLCLERYLHGPKFEQLQQAIAASEMKPPAPVPGATATSISSASLTGQRGPSPPSGPQSSRYARLGHSTTPTAIDDELHHHQQHMQQQSQPQRLYQVPSSAHAQQQPPPPSRHHPHYQALYQQQQLQLFEQQQQLGLVSGGDDASATPDSGMYLSHSQTASPLPTISTTNSSSASLSPYPPTLLPLSSSSSGAIVGGYEHIHYQQQQQQQQHQHHHHGGGASTKQYASELTADVEQAIKTRWLHVLQQLNTAAGAPGTVGSTTEASSEAQSATTGGNNNSSGMIITAAVATTTEIVVAQLRKRGERGGLGISLEGTVDVEDGHEVRPHHYIRSILPEGPVGLNGKLRSGDELLEVNGHRLLGMNHHEVVSILKDLPICVRMVCGRQVPVSSASRAPTPSSAYGHDSRHGSNYFGGHDQQRYAASPTDLVEDMSPQESTQHLTMHSSSSGGSFGADQRAAFGGSLQNLLPSSDRLVKAKSDGSITTSVSQPAAGAAVLVTCGGSGHAGTLPLDSSCGGVGGNDSMDGGGGGVSFMRMKSRSLEPLTGLAMWSADPQLIELVKGERGLGFSILDYQDPLNPNDTVIVIRSLVPGGVAQLDGRLIPGDRLLFVNETVLENASLDQAVQALKGAPKGVVRIGVAKPLPVQVDGGGGISDGRGKASVFGHHYSGSGGGGGSGREDSFP